MVNRKTSFMGCKHLNLNLNLTTYRYNKKKTHTQTKLYIGPLHIFLKLPLLCHRDLQAWQEPRYGSGDIFLLSKTTERITLLRIHFSCLFDELLTCHFLNLLGRGRDTAHPSKPSLQPCQRIPQPTHPPLTFSFSISVLAACLAFPTAQAW